MIDLTNFSFKIEIQELNSPHMEVMFFLDKKMDKEEFESLVYEAISHSVWNWFQLSYFNAFRFTLTYYSLNQHYVNYKKRYIGFGISLINSEIHSLNNMFNLVEKTLIFRYGHTNLIDKVVIKNIPCDARDYLEYKKGIL
jgi:hypothetical protein